MNRAAPLRHALAWSLATMLWPLAAAAQAPGPSAAPAHARAKLEYAAPAELSCPDRDAFASAIATRLGYEAVVAGDADAKTLSVQFRPDDKAVRATLRLSNAAKENGVGWVDRKYNDGSGTFGNRISSCDETESYVSGNTTMTGMTCYCSDLPVPPTVRVRKSEGLYACSKVCTSWSLKCSTSRKHYSFGDEEESTRELLADCNAVPDAATHHYTCACDL